MEEYDAPAELQTEVPEGEDFALGSGEPIHVDLERMPWLSVPPPKKTPFRWPGGAKSPTWLKLLALCGLRHANRYRHGRKDPTGLYGVIGNVIHGAIEDATLIRLFPGRRGQVPTQISPRELLYLLELQADAVRQDLNVVDGEQAHSIVTAEVLARAREIVMALRPISTNNVWIDPKTRKPGVEYVWSLRIHSQLLLAGIIDFLQVVPDPAHPDSGPREVVITDWKTGEAQLPSQDELMLDAQAGIQMVWARQRFGPKPRIRFRLVNLIHREEVWAEWTPGLDQLMRSFARTCHQIYEGGKEEAVVGTHCAHCPYRNDCNPFRKYLQDAAFRTLSGLEGMTTDQLIAEHHRARVLYKTSKARKQDTSKLLLEKLGRKKKYQAGNLVARKKRRSTTSYSDEAGMLVELAERTGTGLEAIINAITSVKKTGVSGWIKTLPVQHQHTARQVIEKYSSQGHTPYWIETTEKEPLL